MRVQNIQSHAVPRRRARHHASSSAASSRPSSARSTTRRSTTSPARSPTRPRPSPPTARRWPPSTPRSPTTHATITQARDNNRQGFPVGAEYLRPRDRLRAAAPRRSAIPIAQALVDANAERAEDELGGQHPFLILLPGLVALGLLCWVNRQLASRFRRRFNVGIAAAFVAVGALTLVAVVVSRQSRTNDNDDLRDGSYDDVGRARPPRAPRPTTPRPTRACG